MSKQNKTYQVAFDVFYYDDFAIIGYVLFENEHSEKPFKTGQVKHNNVQAYVSGEFYKRELPCLLTALNNIEEEINLIYIDANVFLDENKPGLGKYLYDALEQEIPIIGVSKSAFNRNTKAIKPVLRGNSQKPLYVSAIGVTLDDACDKIKNMNGDFRLPTMIKLADTICRNDFSDIAIKNNEIKNEN